MIISRFYKHVNRAPNKIALIVDDEQWTYQQLARSIQNTQYGLLSIGVKEGDHIALIVNNSYEFVVIMLATAAIGAVIVPLNTTIKPLALSNAIKACNVRFVIAEKHCVSNVLSSGEVGSDRLVSIGYINDEITDFFQWQFSKNREQDFVGSSNDEIADHNFIITMTSGSTGKPKPIVLTQKTKVQRAQSAQSSYRLTADDIIIAATPLYHSLALRLVLLPLLIGATAVVLKRFTPKLWLDAIAQHKVTFSILVSSQIANILTEYQERPSFYKLSSLKILVSSSALLQPTLKKFLIETLDCEIHEIYGASEVGVVSNLPSSLIKNKLNTVGKAVDDVTIKIIDEKGDELSFGETGEIVCSSKMAFKAYYNQPELTAKSFSGDYFHTGDFGKLDKDGFLTFMGRKKDIIITGGINTYPSDIEAVLMGSGLLKECVVIGVEDKHLGEAVLAIIVPNKPLDKLTRQLQRLCYESLEDYQQPLHYEVLPDLPKNPMGKIDKLKLQKKFASIDASAFLRKTLN